MRSLYFSTVAVTFLQPLSTYPFQKIVAITLNYQVFITREIAIKTKIDPLKSSLTLVSIGDRWKKMEIVLLVISWRHLMGIILSFEWYLFLNFVYSITLYPWHNNADLIPLILMNGKDIFVSNILPIFLELFWRFLEKGGLFITESVS